MTSGIATAQHSSAATFAEDNPTWLTCPGCGGNYLHHGMVVVFERDREDAPTRATSIDGGAVIVSPHSAPWVEARNPSSRRNGLSIQFECETCDARPMLTMAQHKGTTVIAWVRN